MQFAFLSLAFSVDSTMKHTKTKISLRRTMTFSQTTDALGEKKIFKFTGTLAKKLETVSNPLKRNTVRTESEPRVTCLDGRPTAAEKKNDSRQAEILHG